MWVQGEGPRPRPLLGPHLPSVSCVSILFIKEDFLFTHDMNKRHD